jgi:hypothetical protein
VSSLLANAIISDIIFAFINQNIHGGHMRTYIKTILMGLCLCFIIPQSVQAVATTYNTFDYYPTQQGFSWTYELFKTSDGTSLNQYELSLIAGYDSEEYNGTIYSGFKKIDDFDFTVMSADASGLQIIKNVDLFGGDYILFGSAGSINPDGPYTAVPAIWNNVGETYSLNYKEYYFNGQDSSPNGEASLLLEQTFLGLVGPMTVGAGTFTDVVHIRSELTEDGLTDIVDMFLARDVGIIKQVSGDVTSELVGYSITPEPLSSVLFFAGSLPFGLGLWRRKQG